MSDDAAVPQPPAGEEESPTAEEESPTAEEESPTGDEEMKRRFREVLERKQNSETAGRANPAGGGRPTGRGAQNSIRGKRAEFRRKSG